MTKTAALGALRNKVAADLNALAQATADARAEATGAESKSEGKYDTRAIEASYLAAGQGRRLAELKRLARWLDRPDANRPCATVMEGALVSLENGRWVIVGPMGGATAYVEGTPVALISLASPLGEELDGAEAGDVVELELPRGVVPVAVTSVS